MGVRFKSMSVNSKSGNVGTFLGRRNKITYLAKEEEGSKL